MKGDVLLMGDFNSRVGLLQDYISNDDVKHTPVPDFYVLDNFRNRQYQDKLSKGNCFGKQLTDLCLNNNLL